MTATPPPIEVVSKMIGSSASEVVTAMSNRCHLIGMAVTATNPARDIREKPGRLTCGL